MRTLFLVVTALLAGLFGLVVVTFWMRGIPWHLPPGRIARLGTYLTRNVASTTDNALFPELLPRQYGGVGVDELFNHVDHAVQQLGWAVLERDKGRHIIRAVATTPLLQMQDDVVIAITEPGRGGPRLNVHSSSRSGQGDLGSNTAHILALYRALDERLPPPAEAPPLQ